MNKMLMAGLMGMAGASAISNIMGVDGYYGVKHFDRKKTKKENFSQR